MAYLSQDEEETKGQGLNQALVQNPQNNQPSQEEPTPMSGQSSAPATISANTTQPSAPMPKSSRNQGAGTGTFTNLRNYLQANQGNRVASATNQRVQNITQGANRNINQAQNTFNNKVEQGSIANFNNARQDAQGIIQGATQVTAPPRQEPAVSSSPSASAMPVAQPSSPAASGSSLSDSQTQRFAEILNARYRGPQDLRDAGLFESPANRVRQAVNVGRQTQTTGGREDLLRETFGQNRDYTRGQNKLDSLLLNTSEEGVGKIRQSGTQALATQDALDLAQNTSANIARQRQADTQALRQNVRQDFTQTQEGMEQSVNNRIEAMTTAIARDEQGNPIQKLDALGNPIIDAAGQPVYMTEWDRLPEYFRDIMRAGGSTSRDRAIAAVQNSDLAKRVNTPEFQQRLIDTQNRFREIDRRIKNTVRTSNASHTRNLRLRESLRAELNSLLQEQSNFQNQLAQAQTTPVEGVTLSPEEAALLGLREGTGVYNLDANAIRQAEADKTRLISRDEFTRLQALAQLAGLDEEQLLKDRVLTGDPNYTLDRAGTQTAMDALDVAGTQAQFRGANEAFANTARGANLVGTGSKKVSRGNAFGKKTSTYYAEAAANVGEVLRNAGYNLDQDTIQEALLNNPEFLQRINAQVDLDSEANIGGGTVQGAATGASIGAAAGLKGAAVGGLLGSIVGSNTADPYQTLEDGARGIGLDPVADLYRGVRNTAADAFNFATSPIAELPGIGGIVSGIGGAIRGIDTGAMRQYGNALASEFARQDLQRKYEDFLRQQGFFNRVDVEDSQSAESRARLAALENILRTRDRTNS